jgi:hypothetical protein
MGLLKNAKKKTLLKHTLNLSWMDLLAPTYYVT